MPKGYIIAGCLLVFGTLSFITGKADDYVPTIGTTHSPERWQVYLAGGLMLLAGGIQLIYSIRDSLRMRAPKGTNKNG